MIYRLVYFAGKEALGSKSFTGDEAGAIAQAKKELDTQKSRGATKAVVRDRTLKVVTELSA